MKWLMLTFALSAPTFAADAPAKKKAVTPPPSAAEDNEVVDRRTCKKDKEERALEVIPHEKGCTLQYTKGGKSEQKAHSIKGVELCQNVMKKIQARLEEAGYKCE